MALHRNHDQKVRLSLVLGAGFPGRNRAAIPLVLVLALIAPFKNGWAQWIRQRQALRHIPVIAVTAHAMVTDHERVIQAGCDACISKPVDIK